MQFLILPCKVQWLLYEPRATEVTILHFAFKDYYYIS
jgi:hypothetical protein